MSGSYIHMKRMQKIEKLLMGKVATSRKSKTNNKSTMKNKTHFSLCVFHCDDDASLILKSLNNHEA